MKKIPVGKKLFALVDDEDYEALAKLKWYAFKSNNVIYARHVIIRKDERKWVFMHRMIMGDTDPNVIFDHENSDGLDNQKHNLRPCTRAQNSRNARKPKNNTSGFKGVHCYNHKAKKPWMATISIDREMLHLGVFATPEEAAYAYNEAAKEHHGEFANLNDLGDYIPPIYTTRRDNKSGYRGVFFQARNKARPWAVSIRLDGRLKHIGYFSTPEEAAHAYNEAAKKYHGENAKLNDV